MTDHLIATPTPTRKRPFGLYVILVLLIIQVFLQARALVMSADGFRLDLRIELDLDGAALYLFVGELIYVLVVLFGLWTRRSWAWYLIMLYLAVSMVGDIRNFLREEPNYSAMLLNVIMVFYLNQNEVRSLFGHMMPPERPE